CAAAAPNGGDPARKSHGEAPQTVGSARLSSSQRETERETNMRKNILELDGVAHIALTPFDNDEQVDYAGITAIVDAAVTAGCTAVIPLGIMGEQHKMLDTERDKVLRAYVDAAGDRLHVIAGVTSESTF